MPLIVRSSDIHAAGCFTTSFVRKGARVIEYTGERVTKQEGDRRYENKDITYLFALDDGQLVDGHGMAAFINHSCDANCETEEVDGRIWIVAWRDICRGEELTYDYNLFDGEGDAPCNCRARHCRGSLYSVEELRKRRREAKIVGKQKKAA